MENNCYIRDRRTFLIIVNSETNMIEATGIGENKLRWHLDNHISQIVSLFVV